MAWKISDEFLSTLALGGKVVVTASVTVDGVATVLAPADLSVTLQEGNVRRTLSASFVPALSSGQRTDDLFDLLSTELADFKVTVGFDWGAGSVEQIPIFTGRASQVPSKQSSGSVQVTASDYGADLAEVDCTPSIVQAASMTRRAAIAALITFAFPAASIVDTASDTGTLLTEQTWTGKVWDAINTIATGGNLDVYADPAGIFHIRDTPDLGAPIRILKMGPGGTIKVVDRNRPLSKLYNRVVVVPGATDGSQTWTSVTYDITALDPTSRRRAALAGPRVKTITSPTTATAADAVALAIRTMQRVMGRTETVSTTAYLDPSLELYDSVQIVAQREEDGGLIALTHIVEGATLNVFSSSKLAWEMTLSTRNVGVSDD